MQHRAIKLISLLKNTASKIISHVGTEVNKPKYYKCISGFLVSDLIDSNTNGINRVISGNVLTGKSIGSDGYLGFYDNMITVIPEGNQHRFLGWIMPVLDRLSFQRSFGLLSFLNPNKKYKLPEDTMFSGLISHTLMSKTPPKKPTISPTTSLM